MKQTYADNSYLKNIKSLLNEYSELEWMSDNQPDLMTPKLVKRLNRLRSQIIKELPNEWPC